MRIEQIIFKPGRISLVLFVPATLTKTGQLPGFSQKLLTALPGLCDHQCWNDQGCSLADELKDTEIAHVFEHVLIETLFLFDSSISDIRGWTTWNWQKNPRWTYTVDLYGTISQDAFCAALERTMELILALVMPYYTFECSESATNVFDAHMLVANPDIAG